MAFLNAVKALVKHKNSDIVYLCHHNFKRFIFQLKLLHIMKDDEVGDLFLQNDNTSTINGQIKVFREHTTITTNF